MKNLGILSLPVVLFFCSGCSGIRTSGDAFTVHAESLNLLGFQIPRDPYSSAFEKIPAESEVHTVLNAPSDLTSVVGIINRIIGIGRTQISGTKISQKNLETGKISQ